MKILLTGPNSFSGKIILQLLVNKGYSVTALCRNLGLQDNLIKGPHYIAGDLAVIDNIAGKFDAVLHIAATSPTAEITTAKIIQDNILATQNLIKLIKNCQVNKFIFFSTCSAYGNVNQSILTENTPTYNPCVYGASKLMGEAMLREQRSFNSLAIRLPAILGHGASRHWLANTVHKAKQNEEINIYNPDSLFNNAIDIYELAKFIDQLLHVEFKKNFDYINVASKNGLPIIDIVSQIIATLKSNSPVQIKMADKTPFTISSQYAAQKYGFKPQEFTKTLQDYLRTLITMETN